MMRTGACRSGPVEKRSYAEAVRAQVAVAVGSANGTSDPADDTGSLRTHVRLSATASGTETGTEVSSGRTTTHEQDSDWNEARKTAGDVRAQSGGVEVRGSGRRRRRDTNAARSNPRPHSAAGGRGLPTTLGPPGDGASPAQPPRRVEKHPPPQG